MTTRLFRIAFWTSIVLLMMGIAARRGLKLVKQTAKEIDLTLPTSEEVAPGVSLLSVEPMEMPHIRGLRELQEKNTITVTLMKCEQFPELEGTVFDIFRTAVAGIENPYGNTLDGDDQIVFQTSIESKGHKIKFRMEPDYQGLEPTWMLSYSIDGAPDVKMISGRDKPFLHTYLNKNFSFTTDYEETGFVWNVNR